MYLRSETLYVLARTVEEKLLWCFKLYDTDNSGVIDRQEMGNIMEVPPDHWTGQ